MSEDARPVGKTRDVGYEIGVSRTVPHPLSEVWEFLVSPQGQELWLGPGARLDPEPGAPYETDEGTVGEVRSFHVRDRVRVTWRPADWSHDTTVQIALASSGPARTRIGFHQERLADAEERALQRSHWQRVADEVQKTLEAEG
jgi:uncharacterized protein YndB with AHSA1/START domain